MSIVEKTHREPLIKNSEKMKYRRFGSTGLEVSALSMGCMRLGEDMEINRELVSSAIDCGINYFETTRYYCEGDCQQRTAPGLKDKTKGIIISGKEGIDKDKSAYLFRKEIERQLDILGLDHFKFFQVGWLSWAMVPHLLKPGGILDTIRRAQNEGLIHHVGFTGHDTPENFIKCIETGLFDSITVPYNMINRSYEPTIKRAGELGMGVVAMCPVAGGLLATPSDNLKEAIGMDLPTTEMALRFVLSNPDVSTACSGMSNMAMLEDNVKTVFSYEPSETDYNEYCEGLDKLRKELGEHFCTACRYCMDCPEGVEIPRLLHIRNMWKTFGLEEWAGEELGKVPAEKSFGLCNECGGCEDKCPNNLPIREMLKSLETLI